MTQARREEGFTLVEALVALALGAMVLAAVLATVRVAAKGADRARSTAADVEGAARAGTILAGDAAHALWIGDDAGRALFSGGPAEMMLPELPRLLGKAGLPPPPVAVVYRIRPVAGGQALTRAEAPLAGRVAGAPGPAIVLWTVPDRIEFRYLDTDGAWLRDWTRADALPRAIALAQPGGGAPRLVAELPDLLPLACAAGPGAGCPLSAEAFE